MSKSFLQSKGWEEFQRSVEYQTFRVDDVLLIKKILPFGKSYLYAPRVECRMQNAECRIFFDKVKKLAKRENCIFLRIEPLKNLQLTTYNLQRVIDVQPSKTIILDLQPSEEELLADMHQKTRYNIRLAEKRGVKIRVAQNDEFVKFWNLMKKTTERDGFTAHPKKNYINILKHYNDDLKVELYFAEYKNKILATGIFAFCDDMATYVYGASSDEHRNVMAPYLLHWEMIKKSKQLGYKYYDFFGLSEKKYPGVTRFKRGFGGKEVNYPGTFDIVYNKMWYGIYNIVRVIKRAFR